MNNKNILIWVIVGIVVLGLIFFLLASNNRDEFKGETLNDESSVIEGETPNGSATVGGPNSQEGNPDTAPVEPAAGAARRNLAAKLGINENRVVIMEVKETDWNDSCLGLGGPAESCLQAITQGFRVVMQAEGKTYIYRTDRTGAVVRAETQ